MVNNDTSYDIFLSYARSDDPDGQLVPKLAETMRMVFQQQTGDKLRIFIDTKEIRTADIWEQRINRALMNSTVMVAILSPSYFKSEWCCKEWDYFASREKKYKDNSILLPDQGLIFPIKLFGWENIRGISDDQHRRIQEANRKQFVDFLNVKSGTEEFKERASYLTVNVIDAMLQLETKTKNSDGIKHLSTPAVPQSGVFVRFGTNEEQFIQCLSQALRVTIIGITNSKLVGYLKEALSRKQAEEDPGAFWLHFRIVFQSEAMLSSVNDELTSAFPDLNQANSKRIHVSGQAKRAISHFLIRQNHPEHWNLYEYNFVLPFIGALFEMQNGEKVVQFATFRPGYRTSEKLFLELSSTASKMVTYYEETFEEVIRQSSEQDEIILIGSPPSPKKIGFSVKHGRFRKSVLMPNTYVNDWIAAVVIMLWHEEDSEIWPLLLIRTSESATRELDMLSNISGYINQQDCREFDSGETSDFLIQESAYKNAVYRELREELGITQDSQYTDPELINEIRFYYPDRENLYFYLCRVKVLLPSDRIESSTRIRRWSLKDILEIRESQVLSMALGLLDLLSSKGRQLEPAAQVVAHNLILHKQQGLAQRLIETIRSGDDHALLRSDLSNLRYSRLKYYSFYHETRPILGLPGLQYREFFTFLLPAYAEIGVDGAKEYLEWLNTDTAAKESLLRLQQYYTNATAIGKVGYLGFDV